VLLRAWANFSDCGFSRRVFLYRQEFSFSQSDRFFPSFCQALAEDRVTTPTTKKKTEANYHAYYQTLIKEGTANGAISNAYLTSSDVPFKTKCIIMKYRTGTLYNQKHAVLFKLSTSQTCPLCPQLDSALHILSGCQHTQIRDMITERHNVACRMIFKAISKIGSLGSCIRVLGESGRLTSGCRVREASNSQGCLLRLRSAPEPPKSRPTRSCWCYVSTMLNMLETD